MREPIASKCGADLHVSGCLCPPSSSPVAHVCVHRLSLWVRHYRYWYSVTALNSTHKATHAILGCETFPEMVGALGLVRRRVLSTAPHEGADV